MRTEKQRELMEGFLSTLEPERSAVYRELILHLSSLGYDPKKAALGPGVHLPLAQ